jgi:hypothetical protein
VNHVGDLRDSIGRMESSFGQSGLLSEVDNGYSDLPTVEKRLADANKSRASEYAEPSHMAPSKDIPLQNGTGFGSQSTLAPSEPQNYIDAEKEVRDAVDELDASSDAMYTLETNNYWETGYFGMLTLIF